MILRHADDVLILEKTPEHEYVWGHYYKRIKVILFSHFNPDLDIVNLKEVNFHDDCPCIVEKIAPVVGFAEGTAYELTLLDRVYA